MRVWILGAMVASAAHAEPLPRATLAADPLFYAFSDYWDVAGSVGVAPRVAISLTITQWRSSDDPRWNVGRQIALGVPIYLDHRFEGLFVEPHLVFRTADNVENTHDYEGPGLLAGVQHTWDFHLTLVAAIGANWPMATTLSSRGLTPLDGYFHIGYAF